MATKRRVVVIGAGAAGLAAAQRLAAAGEAVTVLEQADAPGGRAASAEAAGVRFDPTGAVFSSADRRMLGLVHEAGASERVLALGPGGLAQLHGGRVSPVDGSSRFGVARIPGVRLLDALRLVRLDRLLARYRPLLDADAPERGARFDDRSLRDFATLYFGRSISERWIGPFSTSGTLNRPEDASRLLFLLRAASHRSAALATLRGGIGAFFGDLADGLDVRLGATVDAVAARSDGGFDVHFSTDAGGGTAPADGLILAVPAAAVLGMARPVLAPAEIDFLEAVETVPAMTLAVGLAKRGFDVARRVLVPAAEGQPVEAVSLLPGPATRGLAGDAATQGLPAEGGLVVAVSTAEFAARQAHAADEVVAKELFEALARIVPGVGAESGRAFTALNRIPEAMPRFDAGHFRRLASFRRVHGYRRAEGRHLYFAGDHLAGPWLEAAVSSGRRAAQELLADLAG